MNVRIAGRGTAAPVPCSVRRSPWATSRSSAAPTATDVVAYRTENGAIVLHRSVNGNERERPDPGGPDADNIDGKAGADCIVGGGGNDVCLGGGPPNTFKNCATVVQ